MLPRIGVLCSYLGLEVALTSEGNRNSSQI